MASVDGPLAFLAIEIYGAYLFEGNVVSKQRKMELMLTVIDYLDAHMLYQNA